MRAAIPMLLGLAACLPDLGPRSARAHADACGTCHEDEAARLATSRHARADGSPVFQRLRERAEIELGAGAFCDACHVPDGLTCLTCHAAAGNREVANGALVHDPTGPVRGPWGDTVGPHDSAPGGLLTDSALCGTCHEVEGLAGFDEHPYSAWLESPAAADGLRCQDCHMSPDPGRPAPREMGPLVAGGVARPRSDHGFVGLQVDAATLLRAGLGIRDVPGGVELVNHAGHALPDGASFTRELWVEPRIDGTWTGERHILSAALERSAAPVASPVDADTVRVRALQPGEIRFVPFEAPDGAGTVEVCVRYRPVAEGLSASLDLPVEPAVTLHCAE